MTKNRPSKAEQEMYDEINRRVERGELPPTVSVGIPSSREDEPADAMLPSWARRIVLGRL